MAATVLCRIAAASLALLCAAAPAAAQNPAMSDEAAPLFEIADRAFGAGHFAAAELAARATLATRERALGPGDSRTAAALNLLARSVHGQARFAEAEALYRLDLARREAQMGSFSALVLIPMNDLGRLLLDSGRAREAEALFRRVLEISEAAYGSNHQRVGVALLNVAEAMRATGRVAEAEPLVRRAIGVLTVALGPDDAEVAVATNNLAWLLVAQGRLAEATPLAFRAHAVLARARGPEDLDVARFLGNLAEIRIRAGDFAEAEQPARESAAMLERRLGPDHPDVAKALAIAAGPLVGQGRFAEAVGPMRRAVAIRTAAFGADHPATAEYLSLLAELEADLGDYVEALALHRRATAIRARAAGGGGDRPDADRIAEERLSADGIRLHLRLAVGMLRRAARDDRSALLDEAFRLAQRLRFSTTDAAIARLAERFAAGSDALAGLVRAQQDEARGLAEAEVALVRALARPAEQRDLAAERADRERIAATRRRLAESERALAESFPAFAALASREPLPLAEAQALLAPHEALVVLTVDAQATYVFAVRADRADVAVANLPASDAIDAVATLRGALDPAGRASLAEFGPFPAWLGFALHDMLLEPAMPVLGGTGALIVVPDRVFDGLPFGVLLADPPAAREIDAEDAAALRAAPWLARQVAISVLPTVSSLHALRRIARPSRAAEPFLGVGDPPLDGHPGAGGATARARGFAPRGFLRGPLADPAVLRRAAPLPETAGELTAIARTLGAPPDSVLLREAATEARVKAAPLDRYRVVAFATHGALAGDVDGSAEPGLILTPPDRATPADDGYLTASEVAALRLDADWVILSACNTAGSDGTAGAEGLSGLARAFFYAGARALLVSHWLVPSFAAVRLTTRMLDEAQHAGVERAEAHRRAIVGMIESTDEPAWAHPAFWAPFAVVGDGGGTTR